MCLASTTRYPANKLQLTENCINFDNLVESRQCLYYCIIPAKLKSIFRKVLLLSNWHKNVLKPPSFLFVSLVQLLASSGDTIIGFPIHGRKRSEKTLSWEITCINTNATHIPNLMPTLNQGQKNMLASRKQQKCLSLFPFEANILSKQIFLQKYHNLATFIECLKITKNISGIEMLYTVRLIRSFSNTVKFVFATSMPYSVQCAKTNMSYHHRNTTAFCSRRTTMVNWWHEFFGCCYCCHI